MTSGSRKQGFGPDPNRIRTRTGTDRDGTWKGPWSATCAARLDDLPALAAPNAVPGAAFDALWARQVISRAVERMRAECLAKGRRSLWELFDARLHSGSGVPRSGRAAQFPEQPACQGLGVADRLVEQRLLDGRFGQQERLHVLVGIGIRRPGLRLELGEE